MLPLGQAGRVSAIGAGLEKQAGVAHPSRCSRQHRTGQLWNQADGQGGRAQSSPKRTVRADLPSRAIDLSNSPRSSTPAHAQDAGVQETTDAFNEVALIVLIVAFFSAGGDLSISPLLNPLLLMFTEGRALQLSPPAVRQLFNLLERRRAVIEAVADLLFESL
jgi:hypothetical protein